MKIKRIILDPDPRLRLPSNDLAEYGPEEEANVRKMFKVMYRTGVGVGLCAAQVGWMVRLFVMNPDSKTRKPEEERVFWNPYAYAFRGDLVPMHEGCLSLPGVYGNIKRYSKITMKAETPKGVVIKTFTGFAAQIIQHNMGHLDGKPCWDLFEPEETICGPCRGGNCGECKGENCICGICSLKDGVAGTEEE